jgi:hypothetical protein
VALVTVAVICLAVGVRRIEAIQDSEDFPSPIGIARGQTLRVTALNAGGRAIVGPEYRLLDSTGKVLASTPEPHLIPPGEFRSFDVSLPEPPPAIADQFGRIQVRLVVANQNDPNLRLSLEVFDNDSGRTTMFLSSDRSSSRVRLDSVRE